MTKQHDGEGSSLGVRGSNPPPVGVQAPGLPRAAKFTQAGRARIIALVLNARLPTMCAIHEFVAAGALMSYGTNFPDLFRRAGEHVDKILRGTKPSDIPVEQPVKFDFAINNAACS